MAGKKKIWLVEATGHSNEAIAADLAEVLRADNKYRGLLCQDGHKRDFWEVDYDFIRKLDKNEKNAKLYFNVFYRLGRDGPIKPRQDLQKKKQTLKEALKDGTVKKGAVAVPAG